MPETVTEVYQTASKALIARTDALADVGTTLPKTGTGQKPFKYARDLLDWVLENHGLLSDTDLAGRCFNALVLLGISYAVPEVNAWMHAKREWEGEFNEVQEAMQREMV